MALSILVGNCVRMTLKSLPYILYQWAQYLAVPASYLFHSLGIRANHITAFRGFTAPFTFGTVYLMNLPDMYYYTSIGIYAYTDLLDGVMARDEKKAFNDIGVLIDPVADKLCIVSAIFRAWQSFPWVVGMIVLGELMLLLLSMGFLALSGKFGIPEVDNKEKFKANMYGKYKMTLEVVLVITMAWYNTSRSVTLEVSIMSLGTLTIILITLSFLKKFKQLFD